MKKKLTTPEIYIKVRNVLELSDKDLSKLFHLSHEDLKSLELGLMPLDYKNFKMKLIRLKELMDFVERRVKNHKVNLIEIFKTPNTALGDKSALEILMDSKDDAAFYDVSGAFHRIFH